MEIVNADSEMMLVWVGRMTQEGTALAVQAR